MTVSKKWFSALLLLSLSTFAFAQDNEKPIIAPAANAQFQTLPVLPACLQLSALRGDPSKGAATLLAKAKSGCVVPWHWHTFGEEAMMVSGTGKVEMKGEQPATAKAGDYVLFPAKHEHQFTCQKDCTFFLRIDGTFDIHYMKDGKEITPEEALGSSAGGKK